MLLKKLSRICLLSLGICLTASAARADAGLESSGDDNNSELQLQLGLAVSANTSFYKGVGEEYYLFPLAIAEYGRFYLQGTHGGYRFFEGDDGQAWALEIRRTFDGYRAEDGDYLQGMAEREAAWEAGIAFQQPVAGGELKAKLMQDISNSHEGWSGRLEYEQMAYGDERQMVSWYSGVEVWGGDKTNYYFGVPGEEASAERQAYKAGGSLSGFIGSHYFRRLAPEFTLIISGEYLLVDDEIEKSPLVTRKDQFLVYSGIFYHF